MSKLVLIDGHAIMHRAYHALPSSMLTQKKEPINAVYGFTSILFRIIEDLVPSHLAICFDRKEPTFRRKEFADYQAHRPEMDKELDSQFEKARHISKTFNIPVYDKAGFEADDLIGTISKKVKIEEVVVVTGDKDILQLVDKKIKVYLPVSGLSNGLLMSERAVFGKLGVKPEQIVDYKALVGDPSDNYKGVPGIGPKTAEKLLAAYKTVDNVYKNLSKLDKRVARLLEENKTSAETSFMLAKIITDVDFDFSLKEMGKWEVFNSSVEAVFGDFGFKTLRKRAEKLQSKLVKENQQSLL